MSSIQMLNTIKEMGYTVNDDGIINVNGACKECITGQNGNLNRPYGQGHHYCSVVPTAIRRHIIRKNLNIRFNNNRWEVYIP